MIDYQILETIKQHQELSLETANLLSAFAEDNYKAAANGAHMLKNIISVLNSSYQLAAALHPDLKDTAAWEQIQHSIRDLITFMDRTTSYRYCLKPDFHPIAIDELLFRLPDEADESHPNDIRNFCFDVSPHKMLINGDAAHLLAALNEIVTNCYEATADNDTITIDAHPCSTSDVSITLSNKGTFPQIDLCDPNGSLNGPYHPTDSAILCRPFYSTKKNHIGIGLAIVSRVCSLHNGHLSFVQDGDMCRVTIQLPLIH